MKRVMQANCLSLLIELIGVVSYIQTSKKDFKNS